MKLFLLITAFFLLFERNELNIEAKEGGIIHQTSDTSAILYNLVCPDSINPCSFELLIPSGRMLYANKWLEDSVFLLNSGENGVFITYSNYEDFKIIK